MVGQARIHVFVELTSRQLDVGKAGMKTDREEEGKVQESSFPHSLPLMGSPESLREDSLTRSIRQEERESGLYKCFLRHGSTTDRFSDISHSVHHKPGLCRATRTIVSLRSCPFSAADAGGTWTLAGTSHVVPALLKLRVVTSLTHSFVLIPSGNRV